MKLLVATDVVPFTRAGAELIADRLVFELRRAGHEAEVVRLPRGDWPAQAIEGIVAAAMLDAANVDRVIGLTFPAYLIPHPDVVIWVLQQVRQAYDRPPAGTDALDLVASAVRTADGRALAHATRLYAPSIVVANRLLESSGLAAEILLPPPPSDRAYRTATAEDFIVALGTVSGDNRQLLAVRAMRHARPGYRLVVAGAPDSSETLDEIRREIDGAGIADRVELVPRFVSEEEEIDLMSRCIGSVCLPVDQDAYGYVTYRAAMARKPTITGTDSGDALALVEHGRTGLVVPPEPEALASAFDDLALHQDRTKAMGANARTLALECDLSWDRVVQELTR